MYISCSLSYSTEIAVKSIPTSPSCAYSGIIAFLSNFLSLINYFTDDFREKGLSRFIPFLRLITDMGTESIQVAIIFSTLISFKYSAIKSLFFNI